MSEATTFSMEVAHYGVRLDSGTRFRILVDDTGPRIIPDPSGTYIVDTCEPRIVPGKGRRLVTTYTKLRKARTASPRRRALIGSIRSSDQIGQGSR